MSSIVDTPLLSMIFLWVSFEIMWVQSNKGVRVKYSFLNTLKVQPFLTGNSVLEPQENNQTIMQKVIKTYFPLRDFLKRKKQL